MDETKMLVVDDGGGDFGPLTDLRAVFELRTGALCALERIERSLGRAAEMLLVPSALREVVAERRTAQVMSSVDAMPPGAVRVVNGRWSAVHEAATAAALKPGEALAQADGQWVAAHLPAGREGATALRELLAGKMASSLRVTTSARRLMVDRPWHVLDDLEETLKADLETLRAGAAGAEAASVLTLPRGVTLVGDAGVCIAPQATVHPGVVLMAVNGPIWIGERATVGANSVMEGPCFVGEDSHVAPLSLVRSNTVVGPHCKVAGEISFSIFQGYSNKAHAGFLGHSLVGQWVNLGAETTVSNLKNTYGSVRVQLRAGGASEDTGRTFQGPVIGDYVRTAIGSRLLTGSCVGTGAMVALSRYAPKWVEPMSFHTDKGCEVVEVEKFLTTARAMMARRHARLSRAQEQRLRWLCAEAGR